MNKDNLIGNYATALFNNAEIENITGKILEEITLISGIIENDNKIKEFLFSPIVNKDDKIKLVNSLIENIKISKILQNFLLLLVQNSRMSILSNIVEEYNKLLYKSKNVKIVQVISASELKPKEQEWVKLTIKKELKQEVKISFELDPTIIGGVIIKYDSILQDYSIKGSLDKISKTIKNVRIAM